jgi:uncharacterized protein
MILHRALIIVALANCSTVHGAPIMTLKEIRRQQVIMQQWDVSCGPAALATLLTYHFRDPVSERVIVESLLGSTTASRVKSRGGFSLLELKKFVDARGYVGDGYTDLTLDNLIEFAPLIVPINTVGYNHFVVFKGVRNGRVELSDPGFGNRTMPVSRFERAWVQNLGFTVEKPTASPSS